MPFRQGATLVYAKENGCSREICVMVCARRVARQPRRVLKWNDNQAETRF